jgi:nucleotide-binding universal stress UspA family protein
MNRHTKEHDTLDTARSLQRFRSLLVPIDLTPSSDRVLGRVARLPLTADARVTLLHVVPARLQPREQSLAVQDAKKMLADEARHLRKSLPSKASIELLVKTGAAPKEIGAVARSVKAELIVMGRGRRRALRDTFLGSTAERVVRRCQLPVLVVRLLARSGYRRPALALELDRTATPVIALLLRVIPPPRPSVAVIHAFQAPYQGLAYPSLSEDYFEERKRHLQLKASQQLAKLLGTAVEQGFANDAPIWRRHVRYGSPHSVIDKVIAKEDTDLLVLGTRGYTGARHVFLGTVAGDVLRHVACDVLIVPPRPSKR